MQLTADENISFGGRIFLKGKVLAEHLFKSDDYIIRAQGNELTIAVHANQNVIKHKTKAKVLQDVVISENGNTAALFFKFTEDENDLKDCIAIVNKEITKIASYDNREITDELGWVIELGAVSNDGSILLAKCAQYHETGNNTGYVNHIWMLLTIENDVLKPLKKADLSNALEIKQLANQ